MKTVGNAFCLYADCLMMLLLKCFFLHLLIVDFNKSNIKEHRCLNPPVERKKKKDFANYMQVM